MLDEKLLPLVKAAQDRLTKLGEDARPSELMAVREKFADDVLAALETASEGITDAQKIATFDKLLQFRQEALKLLVEEAVAGNGIREDDDDAHGCYEELQTEMFGKRIFDVTNTFEKLMP